MIRRPFAVFIRPNGLELPKLADSAAYSLSVSDLRTLEAVARGEANSDAPAALVEAIRIRGGFEPYGGIRTAPKPPIDPSEAPETAMNDVLVLATPLVVMATAIGFEILDADGGVIVRVSADELAVLCEFRKGVAIIDVLDSLDPLTAPPAERIVALLGDLRTRGWVRPALKGGGGDATTILLQREGPRLGAGIQSTRAWLETLPAAENRNKVRVVPVNPNFGPMLSLGMMMARAKVDPDPAIRERFDFVPDWANQVVPALTSSDRPGIYLFSHYVWNHQTNLALIQRVKAHDERNLVVVGGPDAPKFPADVCAYLTVNPSVDVLVHGEGEDTFADLMRVLAAHDFDAPPNRARFAGVPGTSVRVDDEVTTGPSRDRVQDLDGLPSPYLAGLFDSWGIGGLKMAVVETNRGCPYGCTFCDWGSATMSRIRKFDLERVFEELEWCARNHVETIFLADANFGIFDRDVEITDKVIALKAQFGFPQVFATNYAKNTVKHLRQIVTKLADAGITCEGLLSLQTVDPDTLVAIRRSNIKTEKYFELADEFRVSDLPLCNDIMMGLPGSTLRSFLLDLQMTIERGAQARIHPTQLLVNSPMNEPAYREEHGIETLAPISDSWAPSDRPTVLPLVVATKSFTRDEYDQMERARRLYILSEHFGIFRYVSRLVRHRRAVHEIDFLVELDGAVADTPGRWPALDLLLGPLVDTLVPPGSWAWARDELRDALLAVFDVPDDSATATTLQVQHALWPSRDRSYPFTIELDHDYPAWYRQMATLRRGRDAAGWEADLPDLAAFAPARLTIDDPNGVAVSEMGHSVEQYRITDWELESAVSRPTLRAS